MHFLGYDHRRGGLIWTRFLLVTWPELAELGAPKMEGQFLGLGANVK